MVLDELTKSLITVFEEEEGNITGIAIDVVRKITVTMW
jgi:hypothetical protein